MLAGSIDLCMSLLRLHDRKKKEGGYNHTLETSIGPNLVLKSVSGFSVPHAKGRRAW